MLERLAYRREHAGPEGDNVWADVLMQIGQRAAGWWESGGGAGEHRWQTSHGDKVHRNGGFLLCVQELSLLGGGLDDQTGPEIGP